MTRESSVGSPTGGDQSSPRPLWWTVLLQLLAAILGVTLVGGCASGLQRIGWLAVEPSSLLVTCVLFGGCHLFAVLANHFPHGNELALLRLGMVAFCRTLLPLAVVAILEYNGRLKLDGPWAAVAIGLYLVPFLAILAASIGSGTPRAVPGAAAGDLSASRTGDSPESPAS